MHAMYRSVYNLVICDPVHTLVETSVFLDKRMFPKVCMEAVDLLECFSIFYKGRLFIRALTVSLLHPQYLSYSPPVGSLIRPKENVSHRFLLHHLEMCFTAAT